jgi:hypothetical protein
MSRLTYPEWQRLYEAALLELDQERLIHRVNEAEKAIFLRLQTARTIPGGRAELQAIQDALNSLSVLKRETVHASQSKARSLEADSRSAASD